MLLVGLLGAASSAASAADLVPPDSTRIVTSTAPVSWPGSPDFEYRINFESGPEGADFHFMVKEPYFGFADTSGSPFSLGQLQLDGPGELKYWGGSHGDPSPWSCFRGAWGNYENDYGLVMDPDTSTTVVVPARLGSAPLAGMDASTVLSFGGLETQAAPPNITGQFGVRIVSRIIGPRSKDLAKRRPGKPFALRGYTSPAVANQKIVFISDLRTSPNRKGPYGKARLGSTTTDSKGHFRSGKLRPRGLGIFVLTARPAAPSEFAIEESCGPTIEYAVPEKRKGK